MFNNRLLAFAAQAKKYIIASVAFQWLSLVANIFLISSLGYALQSVVLGQSIVASLSVIQVAILTLLVCCVCIGLRSFALSFSQRMGAHASHVAKTRIRQAVYDKLVSLGPSYTRHVATSEAVQVSVDGAEQLEVYYGSYIPQFFYALIAPVTLFAFLAPICFPAALVLLLCVPLIPLSIMAFMTIAKKVMRRYWGSYLDLGHCFLENLQGLTTLKIFKADQLRHEAMNREAETFRQATMRLLRMQLNSITLMDLLAYGATALGVAVTIWQFALGHVTVAGAFAIVLLSADFFLPMRSLGSLFHVAMNGMTAAEKMFEILDIEEQDDKTTAIDLSHADILCRHVCFSYKQGKETLHDVSFDAPVGSFIGVVGESGSGKSTLAGLLNGRNAGYTGTITIAGLPLEDVSRESLMKCITTVTCASVVFKGTLRSNLCLAKPDATDEELWDVLSQCALDGFVRNRGGLDMAISESGLNLSGGQRQRLSVARALLHDSPIYIFDEATSNIDAESEEALLHTITSLARRKTVIMISHRLSAVKAADCIYVFHHGVCIERGCHDVLVSLNGGYAKLWNQQQELEEFNCSSQTSYKEMFVEFENEVNQYDELEPTQWTLPETKPRGAWSVMMKLVGLVKPLAPIMVLAIILGILGFLAAIFITVLGLGGLGLLIEGVSLQDLSLLFVVLAFCGIARGPLRYGEQLCNHDLAFKILAVMRDKVFGALRILAPAKLEGKDKGNLVTLITSDIELLEVFYAHTISPVAIALVVSSIMIALMSLIHPLLGMIALCSYVVVGIVMPICAHRAQKQCGVSMRRGIAGMNAFVLECLNGLQETLQYHGQSQASLALKARMEDLSHIEFTMKHTAAFQNALTGAVVLICDLVMIACSLYLFFAGMISVTESLIAIGALMSSFGPVLAVAALGSTLQQTLAAGNRVLDILEEEPETVEIISQKSLNQFDGACACHVNFSYGDELILQDVNLDVSPGQIVRIAGKSGSGKSTLCKLFMRFWDVDTGCIFFSGRDIRNINTSDLRSLEGYMTQETHLFTGTLRENICIAKPHASDYEILDACRKASLADFVSDLSDGLDTQVGELGNSLSGGERQRIGLARIFLHDAPFILLDEPTSNLDSLNEASVLRALSDGRAGKTIALISHRESTGRIADCTVRVERGRLS